METEANVEPLDPPDARDAVGREAGIVLAGTPIGNAEDASARLRRELAEADVIAAEDTRTLRTLLARLGLHTRARLLSYHEHNEAARAAELVALAEAGQRVVVVSDAGMPGVSDPGYRVVHAAAQAQVPTTVVPGPSAVLAALALSGLPTDRFTFEGFPPRKAGERARFLAALATEPRTMTFYESPHRIGETVAAMAEAFGADRPAALCRELTKKFEEVRRGPLAELAEWAADGVRGEIVVVVAGAPAVAAEAGDHVAEVLALVAAGTRLKDATAEVAARTGAPKRDLYEAALRAR